MKIPFDIKYKSQIESGGYEVVTAQGSLAKIISWDADEDKPIVALITNNYNGYKYAKAYYINGIHNEDEDSVLNLSIIVRDLELTEFEKAYSMMRYGSEATAIFKKEQLEQVKKEAATILEYARKEIAEELPKWVEFDPNYAGLIHQSYSIIVVQDNGKNYMIKVKDLLDKLPKKDNL